MWADVDTVNAAINTQRETLLDLILTKPWRFRISVFQVMNPFYRWNGGGAAFFDISELMPACNRVVRWTADGNAWHMQMRGLADVTPPSDDVRLFSED